MDNNGFYSGGGFFGTSNYVFGSDVSKANMFGTTINGQTVTQQDAKNLANFGGNLNGTMLTAQQAQNLGFKK